LKPSGSDLVKPTTQTPFHIDFDWWREHDSNWKVYLFSYLCAEHQAAFQNTDQDAKIDWVDSVTAEVFVVDGLEHTLMSHCALQPDFLHPKHVPGGRCFSLVFEERQQTAHTAGT